MHTAGLDRAVRLPVAPRGELSSALIGALSRDQDSDVSELPALALATSAGADAIRDDDLQLSLLLLYALSYGSLGQFGAEWEWNPELIATRAVVESAFEAALRGQVSLPESPMPSQDAVATSLFELTAPGPGPSLSRFLAKRATREQALEYLVQHSVYTLREADAHSWLIPRLTGRTKAALIEIQCDEYGGGRVDQMHQEIYGRALRAAGLASEYGAYLDHVPAIRLASFNLMSMFGMHRRLRGAAVGHLAAFEMTSSIPCRLVAEGLRRVGFGEDVAEYYDVHVEADSIHEQIAARDLAGSLAEDEPTLLGDILFGAAACLTIDGWAADDQLAAFTRGESSLRLPLELGS